MPLPSNPSLCLAVTNARTIVQIMNVSCSICQTVFPSGNRDGIRLISSFASRCTLIHVQCNISFVMFWNLLSNIWGLDLLFTFQWSIIDHFADVNYRNIATL